MDLSVDGHDRQYLLHVPESLPATPLPLVLLFHGHSQSAKQLSGDDGKHAPFAVWMDIANEEGLADCVPARATKGATTTPAGMIAVPTPAPILTAMMLRLRARSSRTSRDNIPSTRTASTRQGSPMGE